MSGREHFTAVETDGGYSIQIPDGSVITCDLLPSYNGPAMLDRVGEASCDSGWSGSVFFAHADLNTMGSHDRMVLMDDLWYAVCPDNTPMDIEMGN